MLRFVFVALRAVSQAIKRKEKYNGNANREEKAGDKNWNREETSTNWVRCDRLSSCRGGVSSIVALQVCFLSCVVVSAIVAVVVVPFFYTPMPTLYERCVLVVCFCYCIPK